MKLKKLVCYFLSLSLFFSFTTPSLADNANSDYYNHWAKYSIEKALEKGYISGYEKDVFKPNSPITRAEFVSIINRAFSFDKKSDFVFSDVKENSWYANDVSIAYNEGYIKGTSENTFSPNDILTREQVAVIIAKINNFSLDNTSLDFIDRDDIATWAKSSVKACVSNGIIKGNSDNTFAPKKALSRAEAVVLIENSLKNVSNEKETSKYFDNLTIENSGNISKNIVVNKDLTISEKIGEGDVKLEDVHIKGNLIINGGGENSIYLSDTIVEGAIIIAKSNGKIRIVTIGNTIANSIEFKNGGVLVTTELKGEGFKNIIISKNFSKGQKIELIGKIHNNKIINNSSSNIEIKSNGSDISVKPATPSTPKTSGGGGSSGGGSSGGSSSDSDSSDDSSKTNSIFTIISPTKNVPVDTKKITIKLDKDIYYNTVDKIEPISVTTKSALEINKNYLKQNVPNLNDSTIDNIVDNNKRLYDFIYTDLNNVSFDYSDFINAHLLHIDINSADKLEYGKTYTITLDPKNILVDKKRNSLEKLELKFTTEKEPAKAIGAYIYHYPNAISIEFDRETSIDFYDIDALKKSFEITVDGEIIDSSRLTLTKENISNGEIERPKNLHYYLYIIIDSQQNTMNLQGKTATVKYDKSSQKIFTRDTNNSIDSFNINVGPYPISDEENAKPIGAYRYYYNNVIAIEFDKETRIDFSDISTLINALEITIDGEIINSSRLTLTKNPLEDAPERPKNLHYYLYIIIDSQQDTMKLQGKTVKIKYDKSSQKIFTRYIHKPIESFYLDVETN